MPKLPKMVKGWQDKKNADLSRQTGDGRRPKGRYLHFDQRIASVSDQLALAVTDPRQIASHDFYPFLRVEEKHRRWETDPASGRRRIKEDRKVRRLAYAAHYDSLIYSWLAFELTSYYEAMLPALGLDRAVIGFRTDRPGETTPNFAMEVVSHIQSVGECAVLCFDVSGFYDEIDHELLKRRWVSVLSTVGRDENGRLPIDHYAAYKSLAGTPAKPGFHYVRRDDVLSKLGIKRNKALKLPRICSPQVFRDQVRPLIKRQYLGIPQGSAMSPVLSNLYMLDFDQAINSLVQRFSGLYRRYCDDILVVCPIKEVFEVMEAVRAGVEGEKLRLNAGKTQVLVFRKGRDGQLECREQKTNPETRTSQLASSSLRYLGIEFDGVQVLLLHRTIARFQRRMARSVHLVVNRYRGKQRKNRKQGVAGQPVLFKKGLYERFTRLGGRNFFNYARKAQDATGSPSLGKQARAQQSVSRLKKKIGEALNGK
jgi:RNA-directed DNA polymerase